MSTDYYPYKLVCVRVKDSVNHTKRLTQLVLFFTTTNRPFEEFIFIYFSVFHFSSVGFLFVIANLAIKLQKHHIYLLHIRHS